VKRPVNSWISPWLLAAWLLPFGLYLTTLAPSVTFYDSGEFLTAIHGLGSAHSPGYPLFLLFAKPFTWLPFGSIAFRVNLATAFSAALACVGAFLLVRRLVAHLSCAGDARFVTVARNGAALAGALLFATSPRLWLQTNHDKPYPLLAFLVALTFLFLLRWREDLQAGDEQPAWWYGVGFLAGLASGAHQTIVLLVPAWLVFILFTKPRMLLRIRELLLTMACAVTGGAVQLYLPLRAAAATQQNWGDPSSLSRFLWHVLRQGYPEESHGRDLALLLKQLSAFSIPHEFGWTGLLFLAIGLVACWQSQRPFILSAGAALPSFLVVIAGFFNPQPESIFLTEEFYTPLYLLAAVLIGVGLFTAIARGVSAAECPEQYGCLHMVLLTLFFLLIPAFQMVVNYRANDQQRNYSAQDYAVNSLRTLPEQAVLFTWGDSGAFPLWYLQRVERMREDLDLPHIPHLVFGWYQQELPRLKPVFAAVRPEGMPAELAFARLASRLQVERPVLMDYSTRQSLSWPAEQPAPLGMVFRLPGGKGAAMLEDGGAIWDTQVLHRFVMNPGWHIDQDSEKAVMIVAHSLLQAAEVAAGKGQQGRAAVMLTQVQQMVPAWQEHLAQLRSRYKLAGQTEGEGQ
jgi:hypothetical protein